MTIEELLATIVRFAADQFQRRPVRVRIDFDGGGKFDSPVPAASVATLPNTQPMPPTGTPPVRDFHACEEPILDLLEENGKRMKRVAIVKALKDAGFEWAAPTVAGYLASLVRDGHLTRLEKDSPDDGYGYGYGLPFWRKM